MTSPLIISPAQVRRLAVLKQHLSGPRPKEILPLVRDLGCLQIDPIRAVERPQYLIPFSRLGPYDPAQLDQLLWRDKQLFEYWAHCASLVLTEDYPLHRPMMRAYPWSARTRDWIQQNAPLKRYVLNRLRRDGPLLSRHLEEDGIHPQAWVSRGWTSGRNISRMLDFLWIGGKIMVAGREGIQKKWDLAERVLPAWTPRRPLTESQLVRVAAQRALRSLGVATPRQINQHFLRNRYPNLPRVLAAFEAEGLIQRVQIKDGNTLWPGNWFIHTDDCSLLANHSITQLPNRTTLLSPFDNLICDRVRTELLFDFHFRIEIYVPPAKRQYGYYVLPILHGDELIGRLDPQMDRENGLLTVNAVYAEQGAPKDAGRAVAAAVHDLATFLRATKINYNRQRIPSSWKKALLT